MRPATSWVVVIGLAACTACGSQQPSQTGQEHPVNQQSTDAKLQNGTMKFILLTMSDGVTKSGARFGGKTYETTITRTKVYLTIAYLDSREGAKKEYDEWLKIALRIIKQEKAQDKPAKKPASTEERAVVIVPATRECKELTAILRTAGTALRVIESCSAEAAIEFEKQAVRSESQDDRFVVR